MSAKCPNPSPETIALIIINTLVGVAVVLMNLLVMMMVYCKNKAIGFVCCVSRSRDEDEEQQYELKDVCECHSIREEELYRYYITREMNIQEDEISL